MIDPLDRLDLADLRMTCVEDQARIETAWMFLAREGCHRNHEVNLSPENLLAFAGSLNDPEIFNGPALLRWNGVMRTGQPFDTGLDL